MGEPDSLHCNFLITLTESLAQDHLFKKKQKLKNQQIFEQKLFSLVKKHHF